MILSFNTNIQCGNCIKKITPFLNHLDIVDEWSVDLEHEHKTLKVVIDETELNGQNATQIIQKAIKEAGFKTF